MRAGSRRTHAAVGPLIVPGTRLGQRIIYARFNIALGLTTHCCKFRNDQIAGALKHSLFAKREWFHLAKITEMFKYLSNFKDISAAHFIGKILEPILPIIRGRGEIARKRLEERVALTRSNGPSQAHLIGVGNGNQNEGICSCKPKRIEGERYRPDLLLLNLFDCADTMIRVNDFLADLEAHLNTSDSC